jgi:DNA-binding beta-propeller fold protein YncE
MEPKGNDAKLYFVSGSFTGSGAVKVINADGSNEQTLVDGSNVIEPDGIEVDEAGGKMYWTDMGLGGAADKSVAINDGRIMRADIDGKNVETLVPTGVTTTPKQLALVRAKPDHGEMRQRCQRPNSIYQY